MKVISTFISIAIGLYIAFVLLVYFKQNSLVYYPPQLSQVNTASLASFVHQDVKTDDGLVLKGYYRAPAPSKPVIIEFHGNASHPAWEVDKFADLLEQGYGLFLTEYRGYGGNPGTPSENNIYLDAKAYMDWVQNNPGLKGNPVIVYGASIGSGAAVDVASKTPSIKALILEVPFDKLSAVGAFHYPYIRFATYIMKNKFFNDEKIGKVTAPTLFLLARNDGIVPMKFGQALADRANEPKTVHVFEEANHINVYQHGASKVVADFLKEHADE